MNMLAVQIAVFAACLSAIGITIAKFYHGKLNRLLVFGIAAAAIASLGIAGMDWNANQRSADSATIQSRLDAVRAQSADLKQRFEANSAQMNATLQEPTTSKEPASVERDQAWQKRIAGLAAETGALIAEKDALLKEIAALQTEIALSVQNPDGAKFFAIFAIGGTLFFMLLIGLRNLIRSKASTI